MDAVFRAHAAADHDGDRRREAKCAGKIFRCSGQNGFSCKWATGRTLMLLAFAIMVAQFLLYATAPNAFVAVVTMLVLRAIGSTLFGMILLKIVRGVVQVRSVSTALGVISATDAMSAILMQNLGGSL